MVEYIWIRAGWDGKYWLWTPRRNLKLKITEIRGVARIFKRGRGGGHTVYSPVLILPPEYCRLFA